ncbi:hypothetical protein RUND412_010375 [Rhizina undulata]
MKMAPRAVDKRAARVAGNGTYAGGKNHSERAATPDPSNAVNGSSPVDAREKRSRRAKNAGPSDTMKDTSSAKVKKSKSSRRTATAGPSNTMKGGFSVGGRKNPSGGTAIAGPSKGANWYYDDDETDMDSESDIQETLRKLRLHKALATPPDSQVATSPVSQAATSPVSQVATPPNSQPATPLNSQRATPPNRQAATPDSTGISMEDADEPKENIWDLPQPIVMDQTEFQLEQVFPVLTSPEEYVPKYYPSVPVSSPSQRDLINWIDSGLWDFVRSPWVDIGGGVVRDENESE